MFWGIFGWGKRSRQWPLNDEKGIVATWSYFSINFVGFAWNVHWFLVGNNRSEDREISYDEVKSLYPANPPQLSNLERYGLLWVLAFTALAVIYAFANRQW